jgi:hypothetical protein
MARLTSWIVLAVVAGVVIGCGPAKELPDEVITPPDNTEKPIVAPTASEPAAKAYVEKAVKTYSGGKPELVAKGKVSRVLLKGKQYKLDDVPVVETVRTLAAVWPDRYVDTDERQAQGRKVSLTAYLHRPHFAVASEGIEQAVNNMVERERNFAADATGQLWMVLFLPQTDPKAAVYELRPGEFLPAGAQKPIPAQMLKLSLGDFPQYQLTFDAKTDALLRVEYVYKQFGVPARQTWTYSDHKAGPDGFLLPRKIEVRLNSNLVEEWDVEKWEFPATIDDKEFSPPKK